MQNQTILDEPESYDFNVFGILKEAFKRTDGVKLYFLGSVIILLIISFTLGLILETLLPSKESSLNVFITTLLSAWVSVPIMTGITMLGIDRAREKEILVPSIFNYYSFSLTILLAYMLMSLFLTIGFLLLIIPGVYLSVSYIYTYPLIVDKGLGVMEAMELSRKTITRRWFKVFFLLLTNTILLVISAIPFGIGLIWSLPTMYISYGLLYHHLFDEEEE